MKASLGLLFVFLSLTLSAQSNEGSQAIDSIHFQRFKGITCYSSRYTKKKYNPLVIVDGKRKRRISRSMGVHDIESIKILKGHEAIELFGRAGKNGVIVVVTNRKQNRKKMS